jgi:hypothetical protein
MPVLAVGAEKAYGPNVAVVMANASHWLMKRSASIMRRSMPKWPFITQSHHRLCITK